MLPQTNNSMQAFIAPSVVTMSSREIADLVEKRHDNVMRTIETLYERGVITLPQFEEVPNDGFGPLLVKQYRVGKRDSYIIVAQLSPEFTARLVDRWQELEAQVGIALPDFTNPAVAARAWADQVEAKQIADQKLLEAAPKVQFFDTVVSRKTLMTATQVGQKLGLSAIKLNQALEAFDVYHGGVKRGRVFKQWVIDAGYGELKQTEQGFSQPLFTPAGEAWVVERLISEGYEVRRVA